MNTRSDLCSAHIEHIRTIMQGSSYPLLFATGGGSHVFGFATSASDVDIHGVHVLPLQHVLGLDALLHETLVKKEDVSLQAPSLEIVTHDVKKYISLLLKGNGNMLEALFSPLVFVTSPFHRDLQMLAQGCITRQCSAHYKGMALNQQRHLKNNEVKSCLHMYRCLLMGIHVMRTGKIEMHVPTLAHLYEQKQVPELIQRKISPQRYPSLQEGMLAQHLATIKYLLIELEQATQQSSLPEHPTEQTKQALEQFLIETRLHKEEGIC